MANSTTIITEETRRSHLLPWAPFGICLLLTTGGLLFLFQSGVPVNPFWGRWEAVLGAIAMMVMAVIGALITLRHPRNPIGWLFGAMTILLALDLFAYGYAAYGLIANPGSLPGALIMAAIADDLVFSVQFALALVLLLFPNGRFHSPAWRIFAWIVGLTALAANLIWLLDPGRLSELPSVFNYFGSYGLGLVPLKPFAAFVSNVIIPTAVLISFASLLIRYLRANQTERLQIKWFIFGLTPLLLGAIFALFFQTQESFGHRLFVFAGIIGLPVATAVAIFLYNLYDIDLIIKRSLIYTILSAIIFGLYVLLVGATGVALQTGSNVAGALLALLLAAILFRPAYRAIQGAVQRLPLGGQVRADTYPLEVNESEANTRRLSGRTLRMAKGAWLLLAFVTFVILVTSLPGYAQTFSGELAHIAAEDQNRVTAVFAILSGVASLASALLSLGLAALFFRRRFTETVAAALSFYLLLYAVIMAGPLENWSAYWLGDEMLALRLQGLLLAVPTVLLLALFPNGRFVPSWSRWLLPLTIPWSLGLFLLPSFDAGGGDSVLVTSLAVSLIGMFAAGLVAQIMRYRHISSAIERQQTKWVVYGFALWLGYVLLSSFPFLYLTNLPAGTPAPWWAAVSVLGWFLALNIVPVSLTIAVMRYRLWDIDVLISRTLVYGVLTAVTVGLYALVVGGMATVFQTQANWLVAFLATGLVAVLFQPLRDWLQVRVNRLLYGHRDEPLEVLAQLGQRLEDSLTPESVLPTLVETIAQTLKLPYVALATQGEQPLVSFGRTMANTQSFPLVYQGAAIGDLLAAPRSPGERFTPAEEQLLHNVAQQAGTAVHALQLTADLQHARQQIVSSREEERRRLRRDLHDGLGPSLAATLLKIGSARALLGQRPEMTDRLLAEMETDIETTLADVRRIVYDLRPPALDQFGLVGALRAYAETCSSGALAVGVEAPESLPPLPAAVEVAAYHIGREGLTNVVRHAQAQRCTLKLWVDGGENGRLHLILQDDGRGLPPDATAGVGLTAMRERAAELGGRCKIVGDAAGTTVTAVLPLHIEGNLYGNPTR